MKRMAAKFWGMLPVVIVILGLSCFFLPAPHVAAQQNVFWNIGGYQVPNDPCQVPTIVKTSVAVNITSATTTELVAASSGKSVYLCALKSSMAGTTPTLTFEYGTKVSTACDTGATALTGAFAPTAGAVLGLGESGGVQFSTPVSKELCAVTTGTGSPSFQGYAVIIQQ